MQPMSNERVRQEGKDELASVISTTKLLRKEMSERRNKSLEELLIAECSIPGLSTEDYSKVYERITIPLLDMQRGCKLALRTSLAASISIIGAADPLSFPLAFKLLCAWEEIGEFECWFSSLIPLS
jgi:hypothetical protein